MKKGQVIREVLSGNTPDGYTRIQIRNYTFGLIQQMVGTDKPGEKGSFIEDIDDAIRRAVSQYLGIEYQSKYSTTIIEQHSIPKTYEELQELKQLDNSGRKTEINGEK